MTENKLYTLAFLKFDNWYCEVASDPSLRELANIAIELVNNNTGFPLSIKAHDNFLIWKNSPYNPIKFKELSNLSDKKDIAEPSQEESIQDYIEIADRVEAENDSLRETIEALKQSISGYQSTIEQQELIMNPIKFYRLTSRALLPLKGTQDAAGFDLFTMDRYMLYAGQRVMIPTGIAAEIHPGWYGRVAPRSGLAAKYGIDVLAGVVDADYRGEIKVILLNTSNYEVEIPKEKAIAQLIIERIWDGPVEFIEAAPKYFESSTDRGAGGFGSTDNHDDPNHFTNDGDYK